MSCVVPKCSRNTSGVEVGKRARPGETVDVGRLEPGVGDRPLGGLDADLARGAPRRLRVRGLADPDDRDLAAHVFEVGGVSPVRPSETSAAPNLTARQMGCRSGATARRTHRCLGRPPMAMPTDIGVIDLMIGFPEADRRHYYDFLRANLRDHESLDEFEFPAQYMFKNVPKVEARRPTP